MSTDISSIAHVQLAVAPVFLLSGIAALLNVLNNRLSRIAESRTPSRTSSLRPTAPS